MFGVDVSHHNKVFSLEDSIPYIDFIIAKASEGKTYLDDTTELWCEWARVHNRFFGLYHYMKESSTDDFISIIRRDIYKYPYARSYYIDFEDKQLLTDLEYYVPAIIESLTLASQEFPKVKFGLYASYSVLKKKFDCDGELMTLADVLSKHDFKIWCARYKASYDIDTLNKTHYSAELMQEYVNDVMVNINQYSSRGTIKGYDGYYDCNVTYGVGGLT